MKRLRTVCAVLLALPLLGSGLNHFVQFAPPPLEGGPGLELLEQLREGGLMVWVVMAHALIGALLLFPRSRFLAALLQLPVSLGIVAFNATLFPPGVPLALLMLTTNLVVLLDGERLRPLVGAPVPAS